MNLVTRLAYWRNWRIARELLALYGVEIPAEVRIGTGLEILHRGFGTVIHPTTVIGNNVRIYHQVTIGRADAHLDSQHTRMERVIIGDGVVLFPGAKILGGAGVTTIGRGCLIAANAVVRESTGDNEVWAGVPARKVGMRKDLPVEPLPASVGL
ncbi:serine O-acetyltransferase [Radicibacter daui]|uniref:serine O-acetyltransferase n=1 Tax=Radicibacter daui TaxID=3064829 RepID=UPI004046F307